MPRESIVAPTAESSAGPTWTTSSMVCCRPALPFGRWWTCPGRPAEPGSPAGKLGSLGGLRRRKVRRRGCQVAQHTSTVWQAPCAGRHSARAGQTTHLADLRAQMGKHAPKVAHDSDDFLPTAGPGLGPTHLAQRRQTRCANRVTTSKGREVVLCAHGKANPKFQETNSKHTERLQAPKTKPEAPGGCRVPLLFCSLEFAAWDLGFLNQAGSEK